MNLLAYLNQGEIHFALEKERKKNKVLGISLQHKDVSFSEDKIMASFPSLKKSVEEQIQELSCLTQKLESHEAVVSLEEIYNLVKEEKEGFSPDDLSALTFNSPDTLQKLSVHSLLMKDRVYFRQKNHLYFPKPEEEVDASIKKIAAEKEKEEQKHQTREQALEWLKNRLNPKEKLKQEPVPEAVASYLKPVRELAVFGEETLKKNQALEILQTLHETAGFKIEGNMVYAAFRLLRDIGIFSEDENLLLKRYAFSLSVQEEEQAEAAQILEKFTVSLENRKDFRGLKTFSIDDEQTRDIDDALSVEEISGGYRFFIHIAHVSEVVEKNSLLDQRASKKTTSLYLPENIFPMLPPELSESLCSLIQHEDRLALSFIIETDENFEIQKTDLCPSVITVTQNQTYEKVDEILARPDHPDYVFFEVFYRFALNFQKKRLDEWKGIDFLFPSVYPKVKDGEIRLKTFDPLSKSNLMVKEMMVLANWLAADFCRKNNLPALYMAQDEPDAHIELENRRITAKTDLLSIIRYMKKSYASTGPQRHFALGLPCYTQTTSPIRRYQDLVVQRQITAFLKGGPLAYNPDEMQTLKAAVETQKSIIGQIEGESNKYWLLKYLLLNDRNQPLNAVVIKELPDGFVAEIEKTLIHAKIISKQKLAPGEKITVKLHTIIPRLGLALGNL